MSWVKLPDEDLIYTKPCTDIEALVMLACDAKINDGIISKSVKYYSLKWGWGWKRTDAYVRRKRDDIKRCYKRASTNKRDGNETNRDGKRDKNETAQTRNHIASEHINETETRRVLDDRERESLKDSLLKTEGGAYYANATSTPLLPPEEKVLSPRDIYRLKKSGKNI